MEMSAKDLFYGAGQKFSRAEARTYAGEDLIYNVTEDLRVQMEQLSVTKLEFARRLGEVSLLGYTDAQRRSQYDVGFVI
jgi:hypothetical protein